MIASDEPPSLNLVPGSSIESAELFERHDLRTSVGDGRLRRRAKPSALSLQVAHARLVGLLRQHPMANAQSQGPASYAVAAANAFAVDVACSGVADRSVPIPIPGTSCCTFHPGKPSPRPHSFSLMQEDGIEPHLGAYAFYTGQSIVYNPAREPETPTTPPGCLAEALAAFAACGLYSDGEL